VVDARRRSEEVAQRGPHGGLPVVVPGNRKREFAQRADRVLVRIRQDMDLRDRPPASQPADIHTLARFDRDRFGDGLPVGGRGLGIGASGGKHIVGLPKGRLLLFAERSAEAGNGRAFGELRVGELVIRPPALLEHDPARLLEGNRHEAVPPLRQREDQLRIGEHTALVVEELAIGNIERRFLEAINEDLDVAFARRRGPNPPDDSRPVDLRGDDAGPFTANGPTPVPVGMPVLVTSGLGRRRQPLQIVEPGDDVGVAQPRLGGRAATEARRDQHARRYLKAKPLRACPSG